ncbi:hypothetical protein ACFCV9_09485 [Streptomyces sp. NPDC056367]|uniref:hypothetical protein n=1 Tax=Streptomyces sp. NPDC056367 TaxID=3345797 RepID=UPI0035D8BDB0
MPDVDAREPRREAQRRQRVIVEPLVRPGREHPPVDLAAVGQGHLDQVRGGAAGIPLPGLRGQFPAGHRAVQQRGRALRRDALVPGAVAGQLHRRGVAQRTDEGGGQLSAGLALVGGRPDPLQGLFHGPQPCLRPVPLGRFTSVHQFRWISRRSAGSAGTVIGRQSLRHADPGA